MRSAVAFLLHAPGLWLLYGLRLGPRTRRANVIAVAATAAASVASWTATGRPIAAVAAWSAGHVVWGAVLAGRLRAGTLER